jgi:hypothetical protein
VFEQQAQPWRAFARYGIEELYGCETRALAVVIRLQQLLPLGAVRHGGVHGHRLLED